MNDPRLIQWLEVTKGVIEASDTDRIRVLEAAHSRRSELMQGLMESPAQPPDASLARALETCEAALQALLVDLPRELRDRVTELRRVRSAARGYLPPTPNEPTLISRDV